MGASDYMAVNGPQGASYALPMMNLGGQIASLPDSYWAGQQNAVKRAQQTAFQDGLPRKPDGSIDLNAIADTSARLGGTDYADRLLPFLFKQQMLQQDQNSGAPGGPAMANPAQAHPAASGPANITGRTPAGPPGGSILPNGERIMGDDVPTNGPPFATRAPGMRNGSQSDLPTGVSGAGAGQPIGGIGLGNSSRVVQEDTNQATTTSSAADARNNGGSQRNVPGADLTPDGWLAQGGTPKSFVDYAMQRARQLSIAGETEAAKIWQSRAQPIMDAIKQGGEITPEQKNARDPGVMNYQLQQEQQKNQVARYGKVYEGINAAASSGAEMMPELQLARSLIDQPNFYSGAGEGATLLYKRVLASPIGQAFGADPNAPLPQEAFRKIMAANVLNQVNQLKAESSAVGGGGRIFQAQIELMEKAAQNPDNSVGANRLLTEIGFRGAQRSQQIADLASNYKSGNLDPGFDKLLRQWQANHPLFTAPELADPRTIAPPIFSDVQKARAAGIKSGSPVKLPDGRIMAMP